MTLTTMIQSMVAVILYYQRMEYLAWYLQIQIHESVTQRHVIPRSWPWVANCSNCDGVKRRNEGSDPKSSWIRMCCLENQPGLHRDQSVLISFNCDIKNHKYLLKSWFRSNWSNSTNMGKGCTQQTINASPRGRFCFIINCLSGILKASSSRSCSLVIYLFL